MMLIRNISDFTLAECHLLLLTLSQLFKLIDIICRNQKAFNVVE